MEVCVCRRALIGYAHLLVRGWREVSEPFMCLKADSQRLDFSSIALAECRLQQAFLLVVKETFHGTTVPG